MHLLRETSSTVLEDLVRSNPRSRPHPPALVLAPVPAPALAPAPTRECSERGLEGIDIWRRPKRRCAAGGTLLPVRLCPMTALSGFSQIFARARW